MPDATYVLVGHDVLLLCTGCSAKHALCSALVTWQLAIRLSPHAAAVTPIPLPYNRPSILRLCKPPLNPLSHDVRVGILEGLKRAQHDEQVSLVVITGGNKAFSAGADIKEMADGHAVSRTPDLLAVVAAIEGSRVPVVAAIGGVALGGGCEVRCGAITQQKWSTKSTDCMTQQRVQQYCSSKCQYTSLQEYSMCFRPVCRGHQPIHSYYCCKL